MFPTGFANWSYEWKRQLRSPKLMTTEVPYGRGQLEAALSKSLFSRGLRLPKGTLTIDREKGEAHIFRSLAISEKGPGVYYSRLYSAQQGVEEVISTLDRMLQNAYKHPLDEALLSHYFEKYLVEKSDFIEEVTLRSPVSSRAKIQGSVSFLNQKEPVIPQEKGEYTIRINETLLEEISEMYRKKYNRHFNARRKQVLSRHEDPLKIEAFLRAVDIRPATSKYASRQNYRNLVKCSSLLTDIIFKDVPPPYSSPFPTSYRPGIER